MATISVDAVGVSLGDPPRAILSDLTTSFPKGTITLVIGANGSGKSVLLRTLLGLQRPTTGSITVGERRLSLRTRASLHACSGVTFQNSDSQIFGDTVLDDLRIGHPTDWHPDETLLNDFGLVELLDRSPFELSGGQRRRLALAGALARASDYLFLDEPFLELDFPHILGLVQRLEQSRAQGCTVVVASHETRDIWEISDQVVVMADGRIIASGPPDTVVDAIGPENGLRPLTMDR